MRPGEVVADRFELVSLAGEGGMGAVWRAVDHMSGATVALKVMLRHGGDPERFAREAEVLARMEHDAIVRHVAHGATDDGLAYLAMEWIDGRDLASRLAAGPLDPHEAIALGVRLAEALGAAHALGVVHRDVKPANVLLPNDRIDRAKLIDFGIARVQMAAPVTRTGHAIGTVGYMAPEQARGARELDARTDVFSLGCVLFECLSARAAFTGAHAVAVLAKLLVHEPDRLSSVAPGIAPELDALVASMLAKDPARRPSSGSAVAEALRRLRTDRPGGELDEPAPSLSAAELEVASVILIGRGDPASDRTVTPNEAQDETGRLRAEASRFGARVDALADGSLVAFVAEGSASDRALRAARCALALRRLVPDRGVALATGRAERGGRVPVGEAIDRAAATLALGGADVRVDEVTEGLLAARFEIAGGRLVRERDGSLVVRTVLGRAAPFVGRDRELGVLAGLLGECAADRVARSVIVIGPAGGGKSRLAAELLARARATAPNVQVWLGRADPSAAAPFSLLAAPLRQSGAAALGAPGRETAGVSASLAGLGGAAPPEGLVRARDALVELVRATCERGPLVWVLEDLHWADAASVAVVGSVLGAVEDCPLLLLATARPEVGERYDQWPEAKPMPLAPLARRAAERLARALLPGADETTVARITTRSEGNALFLEELARAESEAAPESSPRPPVAASVLAMVEERVRRLPAELRLVLRAASVFGSTFRADGVAALVGGATDAPTALSRLAEHELVLAVDAPRLAGDAEYVFHHDLTREAAYATLTDSDRALGHLLAGEWLERRGDCEPVVLAEHFERGGAPERAAGAYLRAAQQALRACDYAGAESLSHKGAACGPDATTRALLRWVGAEAQWWGGAGTPRPALAEARAALPSSTLAWACATTRLGMVMSRDDDAEGLVELAPDLVRAASLLDASWAGALLMMAVQLLTTRRDDLAFELAAGAAQAAARSSASAPRDHAGSLAEGDPEVLVRLGWAEALDAKGDRAAAREAIRRAREILLRRAEALDEARRSDFLERLPENARTLELAREWGVA